MNKPFRTKNPAVLWAIGVSVLVIFSAREIDGQARAPRDQLARFVTLVSSPDGEGPTFQVNIPPQLEKVIRATVPKFRIRRESELQFGADASANKSHVAIATDLDGDGLREAVIWGMLEGSESPYEPQGRRTADAVVQTTVLLGVRQTPQGFEVKTLHRAREILSPVAESAPPASIQILTEMRELLPSGKTPQGRQKGTSRWIRWQEGDCKGEGLQWTVRKGKWVRSNSDCTYGE